MKRSSENKITEIILDSITEGVFTIDGDWTITSFNRAAEKITGIPRRQAIGRRCAEVFRASMCETDCALRETMISRETRINRSGFIVNSEGRRVPVEVSTSLLKDERGRIIGGVETFRDLTVLEELRKRLEGRFELGDMVSRSPLMRKIFDMLPLVSANDTTVLIQGETGTGKELLARAIHSLSRRAKGPFVAVNCGALPDTLLESELFGYKAGAFTGADRDKPGRFALAKGGTLFLDEVGDITPALQLRLLRVLQEKIYEPLGDTRSNKADIRVVAASNRDLADLVQKGTFRQDLFYRLHVVRLDLPPLRKRKEDIPLLTDHLIKQLNTLRKRNVTGIRPPAMAILMGHDYPGNIRELENIIEYSFVLCPDGKMIEPRHLPEEFRIRMVRLEKNPMKASLRAVEAQAILEALRNHHGNRLEAARALGMHKSTLFRKIKALGLAPPRRRESTVDE